LALVEIARMHGLRLIEDCAQSHGALYRGRPTGSLLGKAGHDAIIGFRFTAGCAIMRHARGDQH
jgi:dTDP-4-amino-4,6-dideoxygalactose transaminase